MAKKTTATVTTNEPLNLQAIAYADLIAGRVKVWDEHGNEFYLDPARRQGEFVLRVVPKPAAPAAPLPDEWRKPAEQTENVIDWEQPGEVQP